MRENRQLWLALALVLVGLSVTYIFYRVEVAHHREVDEVDQAALLLEAVDSAAEAKKITVTLHVFRERPRAPGLLEEEQVETAIEVPDNPEVRSERIVSAVLGHFRAVLPARAAVNRVFLLEDGTAVVDFSRETGQQLVGGIGTELALLQSVARSLARNHPQVQRVRFLVEGQERPTLSGHVSIQVPFM